MSVSHSCSSWLRTQHRAFALGRETPADPSSWESRSLGLRVAVCWFWALAGDFTAARVPPGRWGPGVTHGQEGGSRVAPFVAPGPTPPRCWCLHSLQALCCDEAKPSRSHQLVDFNWPQSCLLAKGKSKIMELNICVLGEGRVLVSSELCLSPG